MSIVGDFNLTLIQGHASSAEEVLKQTMLNQEVIFRKQVHELHRLYWMQKILMEDSAWKELDRYNSWEASTHSTLGRYVNAIHYSPLEKERALPMLCSTPSVSMDFPEENRIDYSRPQHRPFDLQLPADQHVNLVGLLKKGNSWELRKSVESNHQSYDDNVPFLEEVKLTLSIGGDTREVGNGKRTWYENITHSSFHHVINLEESTDTVSNEDAKSVSTLSCSAPITGDKHVLRAPVQSHYVSRCNVGGDLSCGLALSYSPVHGSETCDGQNNQGSNEQHKKAFGMDLNRVQLDDSSHSNDQVVACLSASGSSGAVDGLVGKLYEETCLTATSWRKLNVNCFNECSGIPGQYDAANPTFVVPDSKSCSPKVWASNTLIKGMSQTGACPIDLESISGPASDICEDLNSDHRNFENGNIDLLLKSPKEIYANVTLAEVLETCEKDTVFPHPCRNGSRAEDADSSKSVSASKFEDLAYDSSSGAKAMQSGTALEGSNISPFSHFRKSQSSQVGETHSGEQDLGSSDSIELIHQCCNKKKEESAGGDVVIQKAAELLVHFSLANSTSNQDCSAQAGSNRIENEGRDRPQHSLDSYESMVLKLTESSVDDCCVSSKAFEVYEPDKKDFGIQLRRGRRLKDFQRDVLPGLASLSRHEIQEDVNIMLSVIRSREYKRMRSKMANIGNWFAPVKSRRSRINYVGRRYYS